MNRIREGVERWLKTADFGPEWKSFKDACEDEFAGGPWTCEPMTKLINGKKVAVVCSHEGEHHSYWRLFADGKFVRNLTEIVDQMGSVINATEAAEKEFADDVS